MSAQFPHTKKSIILMNRIERREINKLKQSLVEYCFYTYVRDEMYGNAIFSYIHTQYKICTFDSANDFRCCFLSLLLHRTIYCARCWTTYAFRVSAHSHRHQYMTMWKRQWSNEYQNNRRHRATLAKSIEGTKKHIQLGTIAEYWRELFSGHRVDWSEQRAASISMW